MPGGCMANSSTRGAAMRMIARAFGIAALLTALGHAQAVAQTDFCTPLRELDRAAPGGFAALRGAQVERALPPSGGPLVVFAVTSPFPDSSFSRIWVRGDRPPAYLAGFSGGHVGGINAYLARIDACRLHAEVLQISPCRPDAACAREYRFASGAVMEISYMPDVINLTFNAPPATPRQ